MKKKIIPVILCAASVLFILTACGSSDKTDSKTSGESTSADSELVDEILDETETEQDVDPDRVEQIYTTDAEADSVKSVIDIENVEVEAGSTKSDVLKIISYDGDKVNFVSYNLGSVDLDTPGEYTAYVTLNIDKKDAADLVSLKAGDTGDADTVSLRVEFTITVV